jgi:hypothetical protein
MPKLNKNVHDDKTKIRAVVLYNQVGSLRAIADSMGIPYDTMRRWHISDWWKEVEDDLKSQKKTKLSGQMVKLKDKAIEIVEDRLTNGDFFYDQKLGELVRRPVGADTAVNIMRTALDKHLQMEEMALLEKKVATEEKITDRLKKLGEDFQRFAKAKEIKSENLQQVQGGEAPRELLEEEEGSSGELQGVLQGVHEDLLDEEPGETQGTSTS